MTRDEEPLKGINGWLILVAIGLITAPPRILLRMVSEYLPIFTDGTLSMTADPASAAFNPGFTLLITFEIASNLGLVLISVAVIILFFQRSETFPFWFIFLVLSSLSINLLDVGLAWLIFPEQPVFDPETTVSIARQIVACCIWIPYMLVSERVQITFRQSDVGGQIRTAATAKLNSGDNSLSGKLLPIVSRVAVCTTAVFGVVLSALLFGAVIFSGTQPTVDSISFDTSGWHELERLTGEVIWSDQRGDVLSLSALPTMEIDTSSHLSAIRYAREFSDSLGGSLVSADRVLVASYPAIEMISKKEDGLGYLYEGAIFCSLDTKDIMIFAAFGECEITGVREAAVSSQLWESGELEIEPLQEAENSGEPQAINGWFFDPYDPGFQGTVLNSLSDDIRYDEMFPEHPLSLLRATLENVRETMVIAGE